MGVPDPQFEATARLAWGVKGGRNTMFASDEEARKYYVVEGMTFDVRDGIYDRGHGTHRAYMLYRFMRGESEQLVSALQEIRKILNGSAGNAAKIRFIDDVVNTALKGRE